MSRTFVPAVVAVLGLAVSLASVATAANPPKPLRPKSLMVIPIGAPEPPEPATAAKPVTPVPADGESGAFPVRFRLFGVLRDTTFLDPEPARDLADKLTGLGVDAKVLHGSGIWVVRYRCPAWRVVEVADHEEAHELEEWLTQAGFDAYVKHRR